MLTRALRIQLTLRWLAAAAAAATAVAAAAVIVNRQKEKISSNRDSHEKYKRPTPNQTKRSGQLSLTSQSHLPHQRASIQCGYGDIFPKNKN